MCILMLGCKRPKIELITLSFLSYFLQRLIYCSDCTAKSAPLTSSKKPVRVCDKCFDEVTSGTAKVSLLIAWHLNNRMNLHDTERNTFDSQVGKKLKNKLNYSRSGKSQRILLWYRENLHLWKKSGKSEISSKCDVVHLVLAFFKMRSRKTFLLCDVDLTHVFVTHGFVSKIVQLVRESVRLSEKTQENSGNFKILSL